MVAPAPQKPAENRNTFRDYCPFSDPRAAFRRQGYIDVDDSSCIRGSWPRQRVDPPFFRSGCNPKIGKNPWPSVPAALQAGFSPAPAAPPPPPAPASPASRGRIWGRFGSPPGGAGGRFARVLWGVSRLRSARLVRVWGLPRSPVFACCVSACSLRSERFSGVREHPERKRNLPCPRTFRPCFLGDFCSKPRVTSLTPERKAGSFRAFATRGSGSAFWRFMRVSWVCAFGLDSLC